MKLNVSRVQLSCSVKGCTNVENGMPLDRHHVRSQKLFVKAFAHRRSRRYRDFVKRYYEFRSSDIVRLCRFHHELVHVLYWQIGDRHLRKLKKHFHLFSWKQANILMNDFERHFHIWLKRAA